MFSGGRIRRRFVTSVAALLLCASAVAMQPAAAAPVTAGYRDFSYGSSVTAPTGQKPQSKLFFNDGSWWGVLFSTASDAFNVYELNALTQEWSDTGVVVEPRNSAQLDVLFDGTKLYVASGNKTASASQPTELRRFTYSSASRTYTLDSGFPANIVSGGMESGVIDKDTTGTLWFTYTRDNSVYVTRTDANDATWIAPYVVPTSGATGLQSEDQSAVVSYDGQIGVMWSNQNDDAMYFASHVDGAPDNAWLLNPAVQLPEYADDHLNVKSIQATNDGRVFAATKTSLNNGNAPLILLLELKQNGTWKRHNVWTVSDDLTRPMVLVDEENGKVFMFATGPCCSGGKVYMKEAPLTNVSFSGGLGTVFMESSQDPKINNVTSTKQPLNSTTGLVAIAGDDSTRFYLHNTLTLGPDTQPPETTLSSVPANPSGPGDGTFQFVSNENGSTFQCQLDGAPATPCTSPLTYPSLSLGSHTFSVAATDVASNTDPTPATYTWDVVPVSGATFNPTHDASAFEASPTTNNGSSIEVEVDGGSSSTEGMVQFNVTGVTGPISSATLRFFATNGTGNGPRILPSATNWDESTVNWNNRPAITGGVITDTGPLTSDTWHEIDVTSAIAGDGPVSFTFAPDSSDGLDFASSESSDPPELVITFESGPDNTPPETTITGGPNATTSATDATFTFISSEAGSTFECQLDNGGWNSCTSPQLYNNLSV
ncbi:MAG: DNRLRE domain-containing protein, partial [Acidimicrobiales bacterium]|nr:DNRLRE domain-containing protein [Acidimicrobiales bacterium]